MAQRYKKINKYENFICIVRNIPLYILISENTENTSKIRKRKYLKYAICTKYNIIDKGAKKSVMFL